MALFRIIEATRLRNTTVGNPMFQFLLQPLDAQGNAEGKAVSCRNDPNAGFIYGMQTYGVIECTLHTTKGGRVYMQDGENVKGFEV
jgi:hypothetical protein